jgi:hypothetical protein
MNPDKPVRRLGMKETRRRYKVTFISGLEGLRCEITVLAATEGNAAIATAGMLAKPDQWNCTKIEQV